MDLKAERKDLSTYQLSAYVMDLLEFHNGVLTNSTNKNRILCLI